MSRFLDDLESDNHLIRRKLICEDCSATFEESTESADSIESDGACLNCSFERMLQKEEKVERRSSTNQTHGVYPRETFKKKGIIMATVATPRVKFHYSETPLTEIPEDFNPSVHISLTEDNFVEPAMLYEWKAFRAQRTADGLLEKADEMRKYGSPEKRKAKIALEKLAKKQAELKASLIEQLGPDAVSDLLDAIATE